MRNRLSAVKGGARQFRHSGGKEQLQQRKGKEGPLANRLMYLIDSGFLDIEDSTGK